MKCQAAHSKSDIFVMTDGQTTDMLVRELLQTHQGEDAFYVADLSDVVRKYKKWTSLLPRVAPHYAVKCNEDPVVLKTIAGLGIGFDCASKSEIQKVLDLGVSPDRIIYANPCKQSSYIRYAAQKDVFRMTFDNEAELHKVKRLFPHAQLVLRILPPEDTKAQCQLGMKFGCHPKDSHYLLQLAHQLNLNVIGVSFHVGSGCYDATAYSKAVEMANDVFLQGKELGFRFNLLDIGGGFPGQESSKITFEEICDKLNPALDLYFPENTGVNIISEPGRFFVASAFTLATNIIARRVVARDIKTENTGSDGINNTGAPTPSEEPAFMYYVNDGVYGSFNCLLYDHADVEPVIFKDGEEDQLEFTSSVWGPTCDGLDCIRKECMLPEMQVGEWIVFKDMGAYTMCAGSTFNGMPRPSFYYTVSEAEKIYVNGSIESDPIPKLAKVPRMKSGHYLQDEPISTAASPVTRCFTETPKI